MKRIVLIVIIGLSLAALASWIVYGKIFHSATGFSEESRILLIPTDCNRKCLADSIAHHHIVVDTTAFFLLAEKKNYLGKIRPGRYRITSGMSLNSIINRLRAGEQEPLMVTFNQVRTPMELAGIVASYLEADSLSFLQALNDPTMAERYGFDAETFRTMFLPDSYEFFWTTDPPAFIERMAGEYRRFWTEERKENAEEINLSQSEVCILASIVKAECARREEAAKIAGVYLNRLRIGMPLQADPSLVYALGDFSIRRVLAEHKSIRSPYNTYINPGLPPGPINYPEHFYVEAVLNASKHDYIFFCAKEDFSGYHAFARTYEQHQQNARNYQRALDKRGIYR